MSRRWRRERARIFEEAAESTPPVMPKLGSLRRVEPSHEPDDMRALAPEAESSDDFRALAPEAESSDDFRALAPEPTIVIHEPAAGTAPGYLLSSEPEALPFEAEDETPPEVVAAEPEPVAPEPECRLAAPEPVPFQPEPEPLPEPTAISLEPAASHDEAVGAHDEAVGAHDEAAAVGQPELLLPMPDLQPEAAAEPVPLRREPRAPRTRRPRTREPQPELPLETRPARSAPRPGPAGNGVQLVGRDFSQRPAPKRKRRRLMAPVAVGSLLALLLLAALHVRVIRVQYALADALEEETQLLEARSNLLVSERAGRDPAALHRLAVELELTRPERVVDVAEVAVTRTNPARAEVRP